MKDSISYKYSKKAGFVYLLGNLSAICFILWVYLTDRYTALVLVFSVYFILNAIKWTRKLLDHEDQLTFSQSGITIKKQGFFPWDKIQYAEIITTAGKNSTNEIVIELKEPDENGNSTYTFNCTPLAVNKEELSKSLNHYRKDLPIHQEHEYKEGAEREVKKNKLGYSVTNSKRNILYTVTFFVGIIGAFVQIQLLRKTIIDASILIAIILSVRVLLQF